MGKKSKGQPTTRWNLFVLDCVLALIFVFLFFLLLFFFVAFFLTFFSLISSTAPGGGIQQTETTGLPDATTTSARRKRPGFGMGSNQTTQGHILDWIRLDWEYGFKGGFISFIVQARGVNVFGLHCFFNLIELMIPGAQGGSPKAYFFCYIQVFIGPWLVASSGPKTTTMQ